MTNGARTNGGHGGIYAILVIIVILIVAGFLYFSGALGGRADGDADIEVELETPEVTTGT